MLKISFAVGKFQITDWIIQQKFWLILFFGINYGGLVFNHGDKRIDENVFFLHTI